MKCFVFGSVGLVSIILIGVLVGMSHQRTENGKVTVRIDEVRDKIYRETNPPGMKMYLPDTKLYPYSSRQENDQFVMDCRTKDGIEISLSIVYQYYYDEDTIAESRLLLGEIEANENYMRSQAQSAIYMTCSYYNAIDFTDFRGVISTNMTNAVKEIMKPGYGKTYTVLVNLQLTNFEYPEALQQAISDKLSAELNIQIETTKRQSILTAEGTKLQTDIKAIETMINEANAQKETNLRQGEIQRNIIMTQWEQERISTQAEIENLGFFNLTFNNDTNTTSKVYLIPQYLEYKRKTLVGNSINAVVNLGS